MKKIFTLFSLLLSFTIMQAQEPADALRYSWLNPGGTARQQAIGGAMVGLGGDLSANFTNPAGLAFYKTSEAAFTPGYNFLKNKAGYFNTTQEDKKNNFSYGTMGIVWGEGWDDRKKVNHSAAFSLGINRAASFGNNLLYRGINTQTSYSQKFLEEIKNNNDKDANHVATAYPFGTSLAFNTYWIDTIAGGSSGNYQFQTRAPVGNLIQENAITSSGGITEIAISGAASRHDKIFYGGSFGIPILSYKREATFTEADATDNPNNNFDFASITEKLNTNGAGINLKAGLIYKPAEYIRLGIVFHSPTFYTLTDSYSASVTANTENYKGLYTQSSSTLNTGNGSFKYTLVTPWRIAGGFSYVIREIQDVRKQKGFLTAELEYINYKSASFSAENSSGADQATKNYFKSLNTAIDNAYKGALNFKAGGELKFTTIMARLGIAYYGNPYKDLGHAEKGSRLLLSGGLGYRNKGIFLDLTYVYTIGKDVHFPYRLQYSNFSAATINSKNGNILLTFGFKI
jgi:hypothetical protein